MGIQKLDKVMGIQKLDKVMGIQKLDKVMGIQKLVRYRSRENWHKIGLYISNNPIRKYVAGPLKMSGNNIACYSEIHADNKNEADTTKQQRYNRNVEHG
jgi:hypothetical protein